MADAAHRRPDQVLRRSHGCSTTSISTSRRAKSSACWARTARARRRRSAWSSAWSVRTPAACCSTTRMSRRIPMYVRARKGIGYLPQEASIFRGLTVEQNILAILETLPLVGAERRQASEGTAGGTRPVAAGDDRRPTRCQAANGAAWRSRGRSSISRNSCCSTSRLPESIPSRWGTSRKSSST